MNLIRNENMKIYRRPRTWAMIGILILAVALMSGLMKWDSSRNDGPVPMPQQNEQSQSQPGGQSEAEKYEEAWAQNLARQNAEWQAELNRAPEMDKDQREWMTKQIKLNQYYLDHGINPNDLTLWNYVDSSASLIMLITLLTVIVAADMIAAEFSWGTIKLLLVGPASRTKIMLSKYISTMTFALMLLLVCFAAAFAAGALLEGFGGINLPHLTVGADGAIHEGSMISHSLRVYGFNIVSLLMYVMMAFMISAAFRSSSMAIAFSLLFMLIGNTLTMLLSGYSWVKYLLFPNIDLSQYMEGSQPLRPEMTLGFSIGMLAAYYVVFQLVAWFLFTKRDVAA